MANQKISAMAAATDLTGAELMPLVQGGANVQDTSANVAALANAFATAAANAAKVLAEAYTDTQLAAAGTVAPQAITLPNGKFLQGNGAGHGQSADFFDEITIRMNGGGAVIPTGIQADLIVEYACTIMQVTMLADQVGSMVVNLWLDTYANYPPTVADSICAAALPTITASNKSKDATLTGWTVAIPAGSIIRPNINSCATIQGCTLVLKVLRT